MQTCQQVDSVMLIGSDDTIARMKVGQIQVKIHTSGGGCIKKLMDDVSFNAVPVLQDMCEVMKMITKYKKSNTGLVKKKASLPQIQMMTLVRTLKRLKVVIIRTVADAMFIF